jgi:hypothetical protein
MRLRPHETEIIGAWITKDGHVIADENESRIAWLIENAFVKVAIADGGWSTLYRDKEDHRLWEVTYPQSEMHGGGPRSMRILTAAAATQKYELSFA